MAQKRNPGNQRIKKSGRAKTLVSGDGTQYTVVAIPYRHCIDKKSIPKGWGPARGGRAPVTASKVSAETLEIRTKPK